MSTLSKLFDSVLNNTLQFKNKSLNQNDAFQFGFEEGCRTTSNIFISSTMIDKQKFKNKPLYECFIDSTKAFDLVNRQA